MLLSKSSYVLCTRIRPSYLNKLTPYPFTAARNMSQDYKLKDLSKLDLNLGEKREVEVEGIEGGKVLLCNVNGSISAVGSKCTHYGAPMVKGILTPDGRVTCPWHGGIYLCYIKNSMAY